MQIVIQYNQQQLSLVNGLLTSIQMDYKIKYSQHLQI